MVADDVDRGASVPPTGRSAVHPSSLAPRGVTDDRSITGRVLAVLECVADTQDSVTLSAIVRATGLPKPTAHRIATDLVRRRLLHRDACGYRLGMRVIDLGLSATKQMTVADLALPYLGELYASTKQLAFLGVVDDWRVLYLERVAGPGTLWPERARLGALPASTTGIGKAMLAFSRPPAVESVCRRGLTSRTRYSITYPRVLFDVLRQVREEGAAYDREESVLGVSCVSAPILDETGHAVAAISVCGPTTQFDPEARAPLVRRTAQRISRDLQRADRPAPVRPGV